LFPDLAEINITFQDKISNFQSLTGLPLNPVLNPIINPWWLTGFMDGDGDLSASIK